MNKIDQSVYPCIKFGSGANARHFPAETLTIVSEQPLKGKAPAVVIAAMINNTREDPKSDRDKICGNGLDWLQLAP